MDLEELKRVIADAYENDLEGLCDCLRLSSQDIVSMFHNRIILYRENFAGYDVEPFNPYEDGDGDPEGQW